MPPIRVVIQQPNLPRYRLPVYQSLASRQGIDLTLAYGDESGDRISEARGMKSAVAPMHTFRVGSHLFRWHGAQWHYADARLTDVLVLSWDVHYLTLLPAMLRARHHGVGVILWGHGYSKTETRLRFAARRSVIGLADALMFYNHRGAQAFLDRGWDEADTFVAQNSLDQRPIQAARDHWQSRPQKMDRFRRLFDLGTGPGAVPGAGAGPVILFVARLHPARRLDLLLEATKQLAGDFPQLKVVLIGDGPAEDDLKRQATALGVDQHVHFAGAIYDEMELAPWFLAADVFCFPAFIGLSILHAFGYGLPVITCDNLAAQGPEIEALEPGENGLLYKTGDPRALAQTLRQCLGDRESLARMSANATATVQHRFSLDRMVDQIEAAVRYVHERRRRD